MRLCGGDAVKLFFFFCPESANVVMLIIEHACKRNDIRGRVIKEMNPNTLRASRCRRDANVGESFCKLQRPPVSPTQAPRTTDVA